jgi:glycosyltransferase involved in cell wall biosynthesis
MVSMKIAYVYDAVYPWVKGGAEKRIYELSRRLAVRGHEVHCYGMKWWPGEGAILKDDVHLHGICRPIPLYAGERRSMKQAAYFAARALAIDADCDVIDCQNFPYLSCFSARLLCGLKKDKLFITWHEVWGDYWYEYLGRKGIFGQLIEKAAARLAENNITVSERTRKDLERLGVRGVQVVPNGIDWQGIEKIKASEKGSDLVYVGRLVGHKNVDLLIRAAGIVRRQVPDVRVIVIGDGPEMERLTALVGELGLERNVEFIGFVENYNDALALLKSSKVFVSPSTREGFGMAALEANACGLPVVTVNHRMNAVCDLVTAQTGIACEPSEVALAEAIIQTLRESDGMRERCRKKASGYDWEEICDQAERVYESVTNA